MFLFPSLERALQRHPTAHLCFTPFNGLSYTSMEDPEGAVGLLKKKFLIQAGGNTSCFGNLHERVTSPSLYPITVGYNSRIQIDDSYPYFYFKLGNYADIICRYKEAPINTSPIMYFQGHDFCTVKVTINSVISLNYIQENFKNLTFIGDSFYIDISIGTYTTVFDLKAKEGSLRVYKEEELLGDIPEGYCISACSLSSLKKALKKLKRLERDGVNATEARLKPIPA